MNVLELALAEADLGGLAIHPRLIVVNSKATAGELDVFGNVEVLNDQAGRPGRRTARFLTSPPEGFRSPLIAEIDVREPVRLVREGDAGSKAQAWDGMELPQVIRAARSIAAGQLRPAPAPERGWKCRDCEFRVEGETPAASGFDRCWGDHAAAASEVLELYHGGQYGYPHPVDPGRDWVQAFVTGASGPESVGLGDLPEEPSTSPRARTRSLQICSYGRGGVVFAPDFEAAVLSSLVPGAERAVLHFVDFETAGACLPYTPGIRPYEPISFQFSCHSVPWTPSGGAEWGRTTHAGWLNDREGTAEFPGSDDRAFVDALERAVGQDEGPIFHWARHERTILSQIRDRLARAPAREDADADRLTFLDGLVGVEARAPRLVDMLPVAEGRFMTPWQRGRYSIKDLLPAICRDRSAREIILELMGWTEDAASADPFDPYALLPPVDPDSAESSGRAAVIRSGTDAIRAFQIVRYPTLSGTSPQQRERVVALLRQYCALDTAAMAAVWGWMVHRAATPLPRAE